MANADLPLLDPENEQIARRLRQAAEILQAQGANAFRIAAYRRAADSVEQASSLRARYEQGGRAALDQLPGIGPGFAGAIAEMLENGRWAQLDRLKGSLDPAALFQTVPGIGPELATRIHDALGIDTLEALEVCCYDGTLRDVPGVGARRAAAIRAALAEVLGRGRAWHMPRPGRAVEPPIGALLSIDTEYRSAADAGRLSLIAPRRFNPEGRRWLPVMHASHAGWHYTALYSNTAQAHALGHTRDWVVIYFHDDDHVERQRTVVTEHRGELAGRRVVRGREAECLAHYRTVERATTG